MTGISQADVGKEAPFSIVLRSSGSRTLSCSLQGVKPYLLTFCSLTGKQKGQRSFTWLHEAYLLSEADHRPYLSLNCKSFPFFVF